MNQLCFLFTFIAACSALNTYVLNHPSYKGFANQNSITKNIRKNFDSELDEFFEELWNILEDEMETFKSPFNINELFAGDHNSMYYREQAPFDYDEFINNLDKQYFENRKENVLQTRFFNLSVILLGTCGISAIAIALLIFGRKRKISYEKIDEKNENFDACNEIIFKTSKLTK